MKGKILANETKKSICYYMDFHKDKAINPSTLSLMNIWDKDIHKKDCALDYEETANQEHKNFYPYFKIENENFANKFNKEVLACVLNTQLLNADFITKEAKEKAKVYVSMKGFAVGAYSDSRGIDLVRESLKNNFYKKRDENPKINEDEIYLVNGFMHGYDHAITFICNPGETVILPNPCYKLFPNFNTAFGLKNMFYNIDANKWTVNFEELERNITEARRKGQIVKAIVAINPNFPLGFICSEKQQIDFIKFCERNGLVLVSVEGLQNTILNKSKKFHSMRSIVSKLNSSLELISLNSISYGDFFQGGIQAGILDTMNISPVLSNHLYKYQSIDLAGVPGQILLDLCLNRPKGFGEDFSKKYNEGLNKNVETIIKKKNSLLNDLEKDGKFEFRDIEAGASMFVRSKKPDQDVLVNGKRVRFMEGFNYGENFDDYINIYI